jgi:hypothetical protein
MSMTLRGACAVDRVVAIVERAPRPVFASLPMTKRHYQRRSA